MHCKPDQLFATVGLRKSFDQTFAMLIGPLHQLRSRSGIHGPVFPVRHDVDCAALHGSPLRVMGPCLRRGTSMNERRKNQTRSFSTSASVVPSSEGLADTLMPAASIAAILLSASPLQIGRAHV